LDPARIRGAIADDEFDRRKSGGLEPLWSNVRRDALAGAATRDASVQ
jgi:hypothetical protein